MNMISINASTNRVHPRTLKEVIRDSKKIIAYDTTLKKIRNAMMSKQQTYDSGNSSFSYGCGNRNNNNYYRYISNVESSNEGSQSVSWRKVKRGDVRIRSNNSFGYKNNNNNNDS